MLNPTAFDAFAADYDANFSHTQLGKILRQRVWDIYGRYFQPGQHLLELACGTGEDALWLAKQGFTITATDGSAEMVAVTQHKAQKAGLTHHIITHQLPLQNIRQYPIPHTPYDGLYSNFGGLNTIGKWQRLANSLAQLVRPGGIAVLVPMGSVCLWEIGWYLLHGDVKRAMRRFSWPATAVIGQTHIPIWYPSARRLRRDFSPWFEHVHTESLGLWLPPSYLGHFVEKRPSLFQRFNQFEKVSHRFTSGWGDHYILVLKRNYRTT